MTTMLERAARALATEDARRYEESSGRKIDLYATNPEVYQRLARAVLLAVRDADDDMIEAGLNAPHRLWEPPDAEDLFRAMIDAILNEGSTK